MAGLDGNVHGRINLCLNLYFTANVHLDRYPLIYGKPVLIIVEAICPLIHKMYKIHKMYELIHKCRILRDFLTIVKFI